MIVDLRFIQDVPNGPIELHALHRNDDGHTQWKSVPTMTSIQATEATVKAAEKAVTAAAENAIHSTDAGGGDIEDDDDEDEDLYDDCFDEEDEEDEDEP